MKKTALIVLLAAGMLPALAQSDPYRSIADSILAEAQRLYRSEKASWHGTDIFLANFKQREKIGGYFSYEDESGVKCVFFSKDDQPKIIGTVLFDTAFRKEAKTDIRTREMTGLEKDYHRLRASAYAAINGDTLFRHYENTSFNLVPLICKNEKKMYVLTGTSQSGVVYFGNDYLLEFDDSFRVIRKNRLHRTLIQSPYGNDRDGRAVIGAMHSHVKGMSDYITATDLCTLMLYQELTKWEQYSVICGDIISVWKSTGNSLTITQRTGDD